MQITMQYYIEMVIMVALALLMGFYLWHCYSSETAKAPPPLAGFWKRTRELWISLGILASLFWVPRVMLWFDPQAGGVSATSLNLLIFQALKVYLSVMVSWGVVKILFPTVADYALTGGFREDFQKQDGDILRVGLSAFVMLAVFALCLWAFLTKTPPLMEVIGDAPSDADL